jgi:signal transduction histidine kinase
MLKRIKRIRRNGLRLFLITSVAVTWLVFALLVGGMMFATFKLHRQNMELQKENSYLQTTVMLELEILSLGRDISIRHRLTETDFAAADQYQQRLVENADTQQKQELTLKIVRQYGEFQKKGLAGISEGQVDLSYKIYSDLQLLRAINTKELTQTQLMAQQINRMSQLWGIGLLVGAGLFLLWGSLELWLRLFNPIIALSRTARAIAGGHMNVRAPILRDDELGALSETFNTMANAMVEREKERMHFVATVAHDLKNPLVVIGGLAHLIDHKKNIATAQEQSEWLELIVQNTRKLEVLIAELADAVQAATGKIQLNLTQIDLCQMVNKIVEESCKFENGHHLEFNARETPFIEGDYQKIERVILNLISNATKYSPAGSSITVQLHSNKKWVNVHVSDEGVGMSHDDLKKVFIPFVRLEHTQDMASGAGLGLLSVKKIAEAHGGKIRMHSELGKGTRVVVSFPLSVKKKKSVREDGSGA